MSLKGKHLYDLTLAGLPEVEHFRTDEERAAAFAELGRQSVKYPRDIALGIVITAGCGIAMLLILRWALVRLGVGPQIVGIVAPLAALATFFLTMTWLHRRGFRVALRDELLKQGVPICRGCGYLLRGLPPQSQRCPECGRKIDARVTALLAPPHPEPPPAPRAPD